MRVGLIGYGRMGHMLESVLQTWGHDVVLRVDPHAPDADQKELSEASLEGVDGVIEFSLPGAVDAHGRMYHRCKIPAVVGTTGCESAIEDLQAHYEGAKSPYLWGSNFALGVHMFFALAAKGATMINKAEGFDIALREVHHNKKIDSPSGTALTAAERVLANLERKTSIQDNCLDRAIQPQELHVTSIRNGYEPGYHSVHIDSEFESIEISHRSRSREVFAQGAVKALVWLQDKNGFFTVEDYIADILGTGGQGGQ